MMSKASTHSKNNNEWELTQLFIEINRILNATDTEEFENERDSDIHKTKH